MAGRTAKITEQDVANARAQLIELGKPVNPFQIKKLLGEGHHTTITNHLEQIESAHQLEHPDNSDTADFTQRLLIKIRPLAEALQRDAEKAIQLANQSHQEAKAHLLGERDELAKKEDEKIQALKALEQDLKLKSLEARTATEQLSQLASELDDAERSLQHQQRDQLKREQDYQQQLTEFKAQRDKAQSETRHLDASLKAELKDKDRRFDEANTQWQHRLSNAAAEQAVLQNRITDLSGELGALNAHHHQLQQDHEKVAQSFAESEKNRLSQQSENQILNQDKQALQNKHAHLQTQLEASEKALLHSQDEYAALQNQLTQSDLAVQTQLTEIQALKQKVAECEAKLSVMEPLIGSLTQQDKPA